MEWQRTLQLVEAHCEGEIGKVVTAGVIDVPGRTMYEKMCHLNTTDDALLRLMMYEPRGCAQMAANLLLPPVNEEADVGLIVLHRSVRSVRRNSDFAASRRGSEWSGSFCPLLSWPHVSKHSK